MIRKCVLAMLDTRRWYARAALFACVLVLPFLGYVLKSNYPLPRFEVILAAITLLISCVVLAGISVRSTLFYCLMGLCCVVVGTVPLQRTLAPILILGTRTTATCLGAAIVASMYFTRKHFFSMLAAFALSAFASQVALSSAASHQLTFGFRPDAMPPASRLAHFLYLVLDEQMGPGGMPGGIPECRYAADLIEQTLLRYGFQVYPFAYSNYPITLDSVPSILNRMFPRRRGEFLVHSSASVYGLNIIDARKFFSEFRARGYAISVLEYQSIQFMTGGSARVTSYSQTFHDFADSEASMGEKYRFLLGNYQGSDDVLARFKAFVPFRFGVQLAPPMWVVPVWPSLIEKQIATAKDRTFFFAHLLTPHGPYLYRRNGVVREPAEWNQDRNYERLDKNVYTNRYTRYAEQVEFVCGQIDALLRFLRDSGYLRCMTIVIHGDHGSRIRMQRPGTVQLRLAPGEAGVDRFDYQTTPDLPDLLDRFSTLLAIKPPGDEPGQIVGRRGSVLRLLSENLYHDASVLDGRADSVFLFDQQNRPKEIPILQLWKQ